ncbi:hypothetical protein DFH07DRAFT_1066217 [Mycena maculata]|uniref:Uncharacterized protein n=1 Tax=Mycena maculata TaxID=230809 RepID=A0AAD7HW19_9AGAR|nr:hypothetical protein DFH07DRAFT_1066217 [Mycena maculata]
MSRFPAELVELIIYQGWGCLSTSIREHGRSMARWMLVSRDWLNIVVSVVFRDLWITSQAHLLYTVCLCSSDASFIAQTAGIAHPRQHLADTCRSLTVSVYQDMVGYVPRCVDTYTVPFHDLPWYISLLTPHITALHFLLVDCIPTYAAWEACGFPNDEYPPTLTTLHIAFAYTAAPPPPHVRDAARGTFFPPRARGDLPLRLCFHGVRRLVVRDANADFVAFLTTACPMLERVAATAAFGAEDVPQTARRGQRAARNISFRHMIGGHFILRLLRRVLRERK